MWILFFKAMHIVGSVAWFAGLFYLVRIFVYHVEASAKPPAEKEVLVPQFNQMAWRVYKLICNPALMITFSFGTAMLFANPAYLKGGWLHVKLTLLLLLLGYHIYCKSLIRKLEQNKPTMTSFQFRLFNEVPTLFLVAIVVLAVFRDTLNPMYVLGGIVLLGILLYLAARAYKRKREANA